VRNRSTITRVTVIMNMCSLWLKYKQSEMANIRVNCFQSSVSAIR